LGTASASTSVSSTRFVRSCVHRYASGYDYGKRVTASSDDRKGQERTALTASKGILGVRLHFSFHFHVLLFFLYF
jgi:hypothetical protein